MIITPPAYACAYLSAALSCALFSCTVIFVPHFSSLRLFMAFLICLSCATTAYTSKDCSDLQGWNAFVGTTFGVDFVFETVDVVLLSKERVVVDDYLKEDEKEREEEKLPARRTNHWRRWLRAIKSALNLVLSKRKIGTPLQIRNKSIPSFSRKDPAWVPSRTQFLLFRTARVVLNYLLIEIITGRQASDDISEKIAPGQERLLWRIAHGKMTAVEASEVVALTVVFGLMVYLTQLLVYDLFSVVAVGLGIDGPAAWPPRFGSVGDAWSLRMFWGVFWNQDVRHSQTAIAAFIVHDVLRLPRNSKSSSSLLARYAKIHCVFFLSALVHLSADSFMGVPLKESGAVTFYCLQEAGILFEDAIGALYRTWAGKGTGNPGSLKNGQEPKPWLRAIGYLWVLMFLSWSSAGWVFPQLRAAQAFPLPLRILTRSSQ